VKRAAAMPALHFFPEGGGNQEGGDLSNLTFSFAGQRLLAQGNSFKGGKWPVEAGDTELANPSGGICLRKKVYHEHKTQYLAH